MTNRILVTGARGYLGGRLVQALSADRENSVSGASRSSFAPFPGWPDSVAPFQLNPLDLTDSDLKDALGGLDTIVHLAASNEIDAAKNPEQALTDTAATTSKLLRASIANEVRRFVYLSTAHVYGAPLVGEIDEKSLTRPGHPYSIANRAAEDYVLAATARGEIEGIVTRLSNAVGAPAWPSVNRWTLLGNDICRQVVETGKITLRSPGLDWRDFIAMDDAVAGIAHLMTMAPEHLQDGLFNLGGGRSYQVKAVAEMVSELADGATIDRPENSTETEAPMLNFKIGKIEATGFRPTTNLIEALSETLAFCRENFVRGGGHGSN